ncbi:AcidPPc domain-containing protein [Aphelenchoides bicaudatus]|nr:AcidPPc domain-containing protein [Aphelenchoides bicaudatus]
MTENVNPPQIHSGYKTPIILFVQLVFIAAIALISAYVLLPKLSPAHQGYICDDSALKYKYRDNTIDISLVHLTGYFLLIITIFIIECQPFYGLGGAKVCPADELPLNERLIAGSYVFFASQLGLCMNFMLYNLVKYSCGRLRPHFFDVCRPNVDCKPGTYVDSYFCTGPNDRLIRDVHLSFYSGHAATAFYYATFLTVYTQMRLRRRLLHCLPFLYMWNVLLFAAASFVGLSRISDNKHHNSDVVFGALVGITVGVTIFVYLHEILRRIRFKIYIAPENVVTLERRHFQSHLNNEPASA